MEAAQPICIAFSNTDVSKSEVLISSNAIGVTGGNEGIITIPRFAGDWGVYRIVFFDKGLSVNAIVWFWVNSNARKHEFHTYYPCELAEPIIVNTFAFVEIKNIDWDEHCIVVSRYMGNNGIILVDYMSSENKNCNLLCTIQQVHQ